MVVNFLACLSSIGPTVVTCTLNKRVGHNQRRCNIVSMVYISMVIMDSAAGQILRSAGRISSSL